jgi:ATP-dependent Clp protease ATP-binding subunit ClpA
MQEGSKPLVVLLPGPTGTGKTELSKALAEALETKLVRFDMNDFMDDWKSSNLFGSAVGFQGGTEGGALPNALRRSKKRCVLLFDEVEKAHQSLWPKFLTFFDEGYVTDSTGTVAAPKDCIVLMSSNLAAEEIGKNPSLAKEIIKQRKYFSPEFLGRVDKVVPLLRLGIADTARLTVMLAKRVAESYGVSLIIEHKPLEALVAETLEAGEKEGGRGIMNQIKELLVDDFLDLQGERISQARLVVKGDRLQAVALSESRI